jgi:hypothetical protein
MTSFAIVVVVVVVDVAVLRVDFEVELAIGTGLIGRGFEEAIATGREGTIGTVGR